MSRVVRREYYTVPLQGVNAFLSANKESEAEPEITSEQASQMKQAALEQEQIRRLASVLQYVTALSLWVFQGSY